MGGVQGFQQLGETEVGFSGGLAGGEQIVAGAHGVQVGGKPLLQLLQPGMLGLEELELIVQGGVVDLAGAGAKIGDLLIKPAAQGGHPPERYGQGVLERVFGGLEKETDYTAPKHSSNYRREGMRMKAMRSLPWPFFAFIRVPSRLHQDRRRARCKRQYSVASSAAPTRVTRRMASISSSPFQCRPGRKSRV